MELLSGENGVMIYKCGRCPARLRRSGGRYEGRMVGEELYCLNCADDTEPLEVQQSKAKAALLEFASALARRRARLDYEDAERDAKLADSGRTHEGEAPSPRSTK